MPGHQHSTIITWSDATEPQFVSAALQQTKQQSCFFCHVIKHERDSTAQIILFCFSLKFIFSLFSWIMVMTQKFISNFNLQSLVQSWNDFLNKWKHLFSESLRATVKCCLHFDSFHILNQDENVTYQAVIIKHSFIHATCIIIHENNLFTLINNLLCIYAFLLSSSNMHHTMRPHKAVGTE